MPTDDSADARILIRSLATVVAAGGRAAAAAEPIASRLILRRRAVVEALVKAARAFGADCFRAFETDALESGEWAELLLALLRGVRVTDGDLLALLERVRKAWAMH